MAEKAAIDCTLKRPMNSQMLQTRLEFWKERLVLVENALEGELQKNYRDRRASLLMFLYREKVICANIISELCGLEEGQTTHRITEEE